MQAYCMKCRKKVEIKNKTILWLTNDNWFFRPYFKNLLFLSLFLRFTRPSQIPPLKKEIEFVQK